MTGLKSYPKKPTASYVIEQFSTPKDVGLTYGQRLTGFFVPPEAGNYIFAASCTNECQLFISTNDEEEKRSLIIDHPVGTTQDQSSDPIALKGGHTYYVEALSYHTTGDSPMKVGVRMPSGKILAPIPSQHLRLERGALVDEEFDQISGSSVRSLLTQSSFPDSPSRWASLNDFSIAEYEGEGNFGHRISGFFLASETGKYKFFGSCPTGCRLYLSEDDSCVKRSLVLDYKPPPFNADRRSNVKKNNTELPVTEDGDFIKFSNTTVRHEKNASALLTRGLNLPSLFEVSKTFDLKAGLYYYIEALSASKGDQLETLKIGVVQPSGRTYFPIKKDLLKQFSPSKHGIIRELWKNVKGDEVKDLTVTKNYPLIPNEINLLPTFEAPANERYNYGQRLKGYFVAPMTGDYRFVISCDKKCELWMSPTEHEQHKKRVLKESHKTSKHQFNKYPKEQISSPIHLDIGQQYYLEAVHKASTGLDHMSVGVTLPTGQNEWPIPKKYLRFRPNDKVSSNIEIPCDYNLDETTSHHKLFNQTKLHSPVPDTSESRIAQNDLAILGETDSNQDIEQIQNDGMDFTSDGKKKNKQDGGEEDTTNASAKVKVTHLELPFGRPDRESAKEALKIMNKISKDDKGKVKIEKSSQGKGFTLTGLPVSLDTAEVTKIAKGVASVIEDADAGSADGSLHQETTGAKPVPAKGSFGTMNSPYSMDMFNDPMLTDLHGISHKLKASNPYSHTGKGSEDLILQGATVGNNPFSIGKEDGPKDEHSSDELSTPDSFGSLTPPTNPSGHTGGLGLPDDTSVPSSTEPHTSKEPEIESVSVIGNLAAAHLSSLRPRPNPLEHINQHVKPNLGTVYTTKDPCSKVCVTFEAIPMHHPCKEVCRKKPGSLSLGGDSIGTPISDMLPGLPDSSRATNNGLPETPPTSFEGILDDSDSVLGGTAQTANEMTETPVSVAGSLAPENTNELTINKLTDYDVLSVDLDGLKNLPALSPISTQIGMSKSTLGGRFNEPDFGTLADSSTFIGTKLNNEANDLETMIGNREKIIPTNNDKLTSFIENINRKRLVTQNKRRNHIQRHFHKNKMLLKRKIKKAK